MHEIVLPKHSLELLSALEGLKVAALQGWTLAGGTGLAFLIGHRSSEDLDFFRTDPVDIDALHDALSQVGPHETLQSEAHTLTVLIQRTKLSFFRVRDPFLYSGQPHRFFHVADRRDIALMKLAAIAGRGSRKDFVDLYFILREPPTLADYFTMLPRKYDASRLNTYHILKSLTYFEDAESEPLPAMREPFNWNACKSFFIREARTILLS